MARGCRKRVKSDSEGGRGFPESVARDGSTLFFTAMGPFRLTALTLATGEMRKVVDTSTASPFQSTLSPDGKWLAYQVSGGAGSTAFVEPWPPTGAKYEVPHRIEAGHPVWMHGGKALMMQDVGRYQLIDVETSPSFRFGRSREFPRGSMVATVATSLRNHDVMPDGRRILAVVGPPGQPVTSGPTAASEIDVVLNWPALLQKPAASP